MEGVCRPVNGAPMTVVEAMLEEDEVGKETLWRRKMFSRRDLCVVGWVNV